MGFIRAVDFAKLKGWFSLWIESHSTILVQNMKTRAANMPWRLKMGWKRCLSTLYSNTFMISHVYKEGNTVADTLTSVGFSLSDFTWWYSLPQEGNLPYTRNFQGVAEYRFSNYYVVTCTTNSLYCTTFFY